MISPQFDATVLYGPLELAAYLNSMTFKQVAAEKSALTWASGGKEEYLPGLFKVTLEGAGFWSAAGAGEPDKTLFTLPEVLVGITMTRPALVGDVIKMARLQQFDHTVGASVGELKTLGLTGTGNTRMVRARVEGAGTVSATDNTAGFQYGAVGATFTLYAGLWIVSKTGSPSLTVTIQSDDNSGFTTPATVLTFAAATGPGWQWLELPGATTDSRFRGHLAFSGTGNIEYRLALGIAKSA